MAQENKDKNIDTVLFFDEANTTEALSMIKEVMVDRRIQGRRIGQGLERLQFIAACNPYRRRVLMFFNVTYLGDRPSECGDISGTFVRGFARKLKSINEFRQSVKRESGQRATTRAYVMRV